jgi:hypothetical protein
MREGGGEGEDSEGGREEGGNKRWEGMPILLFLLKRKGTRGRSGVYGGRSIRRGCREASRQDASRAMRA